MERSQLAATLTDIDTGRIRGEQQLPALMWVDDRSRASADRERQAAAAQHLASATQRSIAEEIDRSGQIPAGTPVETADHAARPAGQHSRGVTEREQRWKIRTEQAVTTRDDAIAQRQAAASGRAPRPGRNCASRTDRTAQPSSPAPTRAAGRRQLHSDLGRWTPSEIELGSTSVVNRSLLTRDCIHVRPILGGYCRNPVSPPPGS